MIPFNPSLSAVTLTTDGSCEPNPGNGGWAYVLRYGSHYKEGNGREDNTTNNRMEMRAVIEGLRALKRPCAVLIRTDSKVVLSWTRGPKKKRKARWEEKNPHAVALIREFQDAAQNHVLSFEWVKGHNGDQDNERCDHLATLR